MEKKKRRQVSGERTIALALVEVIEKYKALGPEGASDALATAMNSAGQVLVRLGYVGLESISSRVSKIESAIRIAVENGDGKEIARLGAELNRAQRGLPPIAKAKEPVKPRKKKEKGLDEGKSVTNEQPSA